VFINFLAFFHSRSAARGAQVPNPAREGGQLATVSAPARTPTSKPPPPLGRRSVRRPDSHRAAAACPARRSEPLRSQRRSAAERAQRHLPGRPSSSPCLLASPACQHRVGGAAHFTARERRSRLQGSTGGLERPRAARPGLCFDWSSGSTCGPQGAGAAAAAPWS